MFSVVYLKEGLKWNNVVGFALILCAVFVVFKKW
ncbi:MAG: DMT family protein [Acidobacteria bacterium]|nr:DMT family protein [Acidobacteriota bacterium]